MKNAKVIEVYDALKSLTELSTPLPAAVNYARAINLKRLEVFYTEFQNAKDELLKKYGTTEDGINFTFTDENRPLYFKEIAELLNVDVDVNLQKINPDIVMTLELSPRQFDTIMLITKEDSEVE